MSKIQKKVKELKNLIKRLNGKNVPSYNKRFCKGISKLLEKELQKIKDQS